jgi:hypothetical protein
VTSIAGGATDYAKDWVIIRVWGRVKFWVRITKGSECR